jgi:hypothetical protein
LKTISTTPLFRLSCRSYRFRLRSSRYWFHKSFVYHSIHLSRAWNWFRLLCYCGCLHQTSV